MRTLQWEKQNPEVIFKDFRFFLVIMFLFHFNSRTETYLKQELCNPVGSQARFLSITLQYTLSFRKDNH